MSLKQTTVVLVAAVLGTVSALLSSAVGPFASTAAGASASVTGELKKWHPITLSFAGPTSSETSTSPNPFLDRRLQITFTAPSGQAYTVPGFFDGDGNGGATGNVWRAHFSPDEAGTWSYKASFRRGTNIAVDLSPTAGTPASFDGASGTFEVADRDSAAPGFLKWGRLEYVGKHYLKFRDGPYWIKGGPNSPENLLAYSGFDNTPNAKHTFSPHVQDWTTGDPVFNASSSDAGKGLIGALNYLSSQGANSIFFLPMNIGGDGRDTSPYVSVASWGGSTSNDNKHFDISKLRQWQTAFAHAQKKGIHLHFVLGEAQEVHKKELDGATLGVERKLFYREMVARYGHHLALQWNVSEEYNFIYPLSPATVKAFAGYIQQQDPYDHPITVHHTGDAINGWTPFLGDSRFSTTSLQCCRKSADESFSSRVELWLEKTTSSGRPLPVSFDEFCGLCTTTAGEWRKKILWPIYLSGGQLEWFVPGGDPGVDTTLEDFRPSYEELLTYTRYARSFMEGNLPFWEMAPRDGLLSGESGESTAYGGGQVFVKPGELYSVYLPDATSTGSLDLSGVSGDFQKSWYNPRTGAFVGTPQTVSGGGKRSLGAPPNSASSDWVVLIKKP